MRQQDASNTSIVVDQMPVAQAVEELIRKYDRLVFHTIYGMTGDWEESQDLTQDTFHQAVKGFEAARAASGEQFHEKAWLLRIAVNTVRMQHRRRGIIRFIPFSKLSARVGDDRRSAAGEEMTGERVAPVQPVGYGINASPDPAEQVAERDAVQRTLARLPETQRECLILAIAGEFSTREIAALLDLREDAVRQRLARARKQFQQFYLQESGDGGASVQQTDMPRKPNAAHQNRDERVEYSNEEDTNIVQRLNLAHFPR